MEVTKGKKKVISQRLKKNEKIERYISWEAGKLGCWDEEKG